MSGIVLDRYPGRPGAVTRERVGRTKLWPTFVGQFLRRYFRVVLMPELPSLIRVRTSGLVLDRYPRWPGALTRERVRHTQLLPICCCTVCVSL